MRLEKHLAPNIVNHTPLTPVEFLNRSVEAYPHRPAVVWRERVWTYRAFHEVVQRFSAFLIEQNIKHGDVVSIIAQNRPEMLAAHYAIPMVGAVLNTINTRLDEAAIAYILNDSDSCLIIAENTYAQLMESAANKTQTPLFILGNETTRTDSSREYVNFLNSDVIPIPIDHQDHVTDEWQPICLNYTSGTTGKPKGVVYHHRGAYLNSIGSVLSLSLNQTSVYLWTLPMFHCNGWCHTWAVTAAGGLHVCQDGIQPEQIFDAMEAHQVTHMSCAPVVLYMLIDHLDRVERTPSNRLIVATGGAAPTSTLIAQLDALGFDLIHLYGLTESYGPATLCVLDDIGLNADVETRAKLLARQGVRHLTANRVRVISETGEDVSRNGEELGEIVLRGNTLMAGYYGDAEATAAAFSDGFFHTGDIAVMHPDGNIEIKDRSKDIIISGGENISSLEIESVLHQHPHVLFAAVVATPDPKWGEIPCAFLELKQNTQVTTEELLEFCKSRLAGFKVPRRYFFQELPKTATGKIQKFALREIAAEKVRSA